MRTVLFLSALSLVLAFPLTVLAEDEWNGPRFDLESLEGGELSEEDVFSDGTLYLIDFWASWCRPCEQYLPHLAEMVEEYGERGFRVTIFCVDDAGSISTAQGLLAAAGYPFTILFDPEADVQADLGVRTIPTTVILDPTGEEVWRHVGYEQGDEDEVREQIELLLPEEEEETEEEGEEELEEAEEEEVEEPEEEEQEEVIDESGNEE